MRRATARRKGRSGLFLAGALALGSAGLLAQAPGAAHIAFIEAAQIAAPRHPAVHSLPVLPLQIRAAEYSVDYARRTLLPAMGGSIVAGDIDGDGRLDLYVVQPGSSNALFRNLGGDRFRDVTAKANVAGPAGSMSASFSDYDRSGHPSLFVAGASGITVYHNNGDGTFSDVTRKAGFPAKSGELYTSVVLADIDGDQFPDLLATVYTDLNRPPAKAAFTFPNDFSGAVSRLYRNNGDGTFTDVTSTAGLAGNPGRGRKAFFADFNADGRLDLLILRDDKPPALYLNRGGNKFEDKTWDAGEALTRHAFFDAAVVDLNRDGKPDIVLWSGLSFRVLLNSEDGEFERAESIPLLDPLLRPFGFHGTVADLDGNGFEDVVTVDRQGRLHIFANQAGKFQEVALEFPSGFEAAALTPFKLEHSEGFAAARSDGSVILIGPRDMRTKR